MEISHDADWDQGREKYGIGFVALNQPFGHSLFSGSRVWNGPDFKSRNSTSTTADIFLSQTVLFL